MVCRLCGTRTARRACPALREDICSVCCGTKRESEIRCPSDCRHLARARSHPASVVRRQQEADLKLFLPTLQDLTERQAELAWQVLAFVRDYRGDTLLRTTDADIEAGAAALASTYEVSARGLIYEQRPSSLPAQRFADELKTFVASIPADRVSSLDRDLSAVLRAVERGAGATRKAPTDAEPGYQALLRRVMVPAQREPAQPSSGGLVEPGGSMLIRP